MSATPEKAQTPLEIADSMMAAAAIELREIRYTNHEHPSQQFRGKTTDERMIKLGAETTALREVYEEVVGEDARRRGIIASYLHELTGKLVELKRKKYGADTKVMLEHNQVWYAQ